AGGSGLAGLVVAGPEAGPVLEGAFAAAQSSDPPATRIVHVPDAEAAAAEVAPWLRAGDTVLVKGPRAMGLERTAELLLRGAQQ
ncbi:MAG: UDP-N-acetylmuramoyl-tripeptide--D-alanyl-D-alanine ligase, partial [Nonomuraea sp.]|nr:UDP-N-acetylmuramoyl-tripeptide--D-alanyl-D-alanine ligase [Nonomuraea sp.]